MMCCIIKPDHAFGLSSQLKNIIKIPCTFDKSKLTFVSTMAMLGLQIARRITQVVRISAAIAMTTFVPIAESEIVSGGNICRHQDFYLKFIYV